MALTNGERRRLLELAQQLSTDDPDLARRLTAPEKVPAKRALRAMMTSALGIVAAVIVCVVGAWIAVRLIFGGGLALLAIAGIIMAVAALSRRGGADRD